MRGPLISKVSVIIPTKNEENGIARVLEQLASLTVNEVLVVDGSSDKTASIASRMGAKIIVEDRLGYGRALQTGLENANGDVVVFIDGDYTYDAGDIQRLIEPIISGEADVVLGNRFRGDREKGSMSALNWFGNRVISSVISILFSTLIDDSQTGLRAFRKDLVKEFEYSNFGMSYVTEQLLLFIKNGVRIREIPINYRKRIGESKLSPIRDGYSIFRIILLSRMM